MFQKLPIIIPRKQGLLTRQELAQYLQVGYGAVPNIARRFKLGEVDAHYPERLVWRNLLGWLPRTTQGEQLLRTQLQDINWVSQTLGPAPSTIRNDIQNGSWGFALGVQLGDTSAARPPRTRRWWPAEILAEQDGTQVEVFHHVRPYRINERSQSILNQFPSINEAHEKHPEDKGELAWLFTDNAGPPENGPR
ncbi:hypothetical protein FIU89_15445 [Roseovarius sp. THAF27]|uniref:hypothetical protein n=1 Tax=Roseovarius sp. THAF27 TaxID=2587850 RepID=UPI001268BF0C|nr:hypothetical protein [Roseovarius sp. THAF27]QFT82019.1 hypothetical protein FIU89_15445 [Roseovarius sp. THAF27]